MMTDKGVDEPEFTIDGDNNKDDEDSNTINTTPPSSPGMSPLNVSTPTSDHDFLDHQDTHRDCFGPTGRWKYPLFWGCWNVLLQPLFWMAWLCTPCLYGQLMQRMGLTCTGMPTYQDRDELGRPRGSVKGTCMFIAVFTCIAYLFFIFLKGWLIDFVWYLFVIYMVFMGILLRSVVRQYFGIGPISSVLSCWDGMLEDCLIAIFCSCCSGMQMARHTHDETRYPYNACSNTGLLSYAPELWQFNNQTALLEEDNPNAPHDNTAAAAHPYRSSPTRRRDNNNKPENNDIEDRLANVDIV